MADNIYEFLTTEAPSSTTGGVNAAENQDPDTVNNGIRAFKQRIAEFIDDLGAVNTVAGTADAITVTLASGFTAYATGMLFRFIAGGTNTGATTINVNSIGAKAIRKISGGTDVALAAGDIADGGYYDLVYDSAANSAAGAWILIGGTSSNSISSDTFTVTSTDAGAGAAPTITGYRNSASPADGDLGPQINFDGEDDAGNQQTYANISSRFDDVSNATEDGTMLLKAVLAGTLTTYAYIGANAAGTATANAVGLPLGQLSFPATQNASTDANTLDDYEEGTWTPEITFDTPGNLSVAYTIQIGTYVKIGKLVTVTFAILTSTFTHTTASGDVKITGLPFTCETRANTFYQGALGYEGITKANYTGFVARTSSNTTYLNIGASGSAQSITAVGSSDLPSGTQKTLRATLSYIASA